MNCNVYVYLGGVWVDITPDVLDSPGINCTVGIPGNQETDRIAKAGTLSFALKNNSGEYTPGGVSASADWKKGTLIKVVFQHMIEKVKFIGRVNTIKLNYAYNNDRVYVTALDWMYFASQLPLDIPALQEDKRADQIISTILGFSPIQPTSTSLQTGTSTFPYAFHDNTVKTTAYSEISKSVMSEWGYSYVKQDGTLVFEAYGGRSNTQKQVTQVTDNGVNLLTQSSENLLTESGEEIITDAYTVSTVNAEFDTLGSIEFEYGERIINRAAVQVYPYKLGSTDVLVYTNETNQLIPANETVSFRVQFTDPSSRQPIAAAAPIVKQYTLVHFDLPDDGISGIVDTAEPKIAGTTTSFNQVGGGYSTSPKKFGTACYSFNGSSDYIYSETQEKFNFRNGDFTVDWWEYRLNTTSGKAMISRSTTAAVPSYLLGNSDGSSALVYITSDGINWDIANGKTLGTITTSTWVHYAITRSGNTYKTFKDGVQQDTWTSSATIYPSSDDFSIALYNGAYLYGYIDELRMIKGYAAWTADFDVPVRQHELSGIGWSVYTTPPKSGTELTSSITATTSTGGAGLDFQVVSSSASDGYLNLDIYATPLESLSAISHVSEDATSINSYGYFGENIEMRLRQDVVFAATVAAELVAAEKNPRTVLNKISLPVNKNANNKALFMYCDLGDLVNIADPLSGYDDLNHIQQISWQAVRGDNGWLVYMDLILKQA